jgi:hypothetical protein
MNNEETKPEPNQSGEDLQEETEAAEAAARQRAIESEQKEIVVFPSNE